MKRPVSAVGLLIMIAAVVVGFKPTLPSLLLLFATTIFGGHMIKKHAPESHKGFVKLFGYIAAGANIFAAGLIMLTPLDYVDKASGAFLSMLVGFVILTLIQRQNESDRESGS